MEKTVDLPGWYPKDPDGDGILVGADMEPTDRALRELKAEVERAIKPARVRSIRQRLKLSQRRAGEILGGGPRAFQKYESGEVTVSRPMAQLLRLLARDPKRLKELTTPDPAE
jgi:HTH-type transcriptional regulator/antitoxin MqsA